MSKVETKKINEAPNYLIAADGMVLNAKTERPVTESAGSVRLNVDGKRKTFKVVKLVDQYFPKKVDAPAKKETATKDKPKAEKKKSDNGGKKDKKFYDKVRSDYDKDPESFNIMKYSKKVGVSYGRIWSIIKLHKAKNKSDDK